MDTGVKDIVEHEVEEEDVLPPEPPVTKPSKPFSKKWVSRRRPVVLDPTASNTGRPNQANPASAPPSSSLSSETPSGSQPPLSDAERIHLENIRKMQRMTPEEIEREREEIFRSMDPAVLESLLRRAELKEAENNPQAKKEPPAEPALRAPGVAVHGTKAPPKGSIADWDPAPETVKVESLSAPIREEPSSPPPQSRIQTDEIKNANLPPHPDDAGSTVHFPPPPEDLKQFFPDLPVETEKLAWMQPISESEEAEYSTELASVAPSELRFDFKGNLITPRQSRNISTKAGLHHHGDAPSAAGYTLPELAHLCRSSHPAQRALAIQTAGRVLHKLRLRKFARSSDLQEGLSALVSTTRIMDTLAEAADDSTRSLTVRTLATEALWLAHTDHYTTGKKSGEAADLNCEDELEPSHCT